MKRVHINERIKYSDSAYMCDRLDVRTMVRTGWIKSNVGLRCQRYICGCGVLSPSRVFLSIAVHF